MIFNSLPFVVFLVVVFALHWLPLTRSRRHQNIVLLIASYVFYGWWDPRFLILILFSSLLDYFVGLRIGGTMDRKQRHIWLMVSITANLGLLFFFKYFNFFVSSFKLAFGQPDVPSTLDIILPVGISFYTFQTMSYTIDVYRRQMEPTRNLLQFLTFVSFFPQLVAGPIERAKTLLPQIASTRMFSHENAVIGCRWILFGAFKKIVIDRIGPIVNSIFESPDQFGGWLAFLGLALFFMQIYCDFSGYSDIAIGTAKLFNVDLMLNFDRPFFSTSLRAFWGRWHISLMTWFRDYVYIPLGGNRGRRIFVDRNIMLTFGLSGLWHGANWNFLIWGLLHGLFLIIEQRTGSEKARLPRWLKWLLIMVPFTMTMVFFRASDLDHALLYLSHMFGSGAGWADVQLLIRRTDITLFSLLMTIALIAFMLLIEKLSMLEEWVHRFNTIRSLRYATYGLITVLIGYFGVFTDTSAFIYFQF